MYLKPIYYCLRKARVLHNWYSKTKTNSFNFSKHSLQSFSMSKTQDSASVTKRLQSELMGLMMSSTPGVSAFPESDSNLLRWLGTIEGPQGTYYEGLKYKIRIDFPSNYPFVAPTIIFTSPVWHPNVDMAGNICLDILKEKWSAVYNVQTILLSLQSLLGEPNNNSPLNAQAADLWDKADEYKRKLMERSAQQCA